MLNKSSMNISLIILLIVALVAVSGIFTLIYTSTQTSQDKIGQATRIVDDSDEEQLIEIDEPINRNSLSDIKESREEYIPIDSEEQIKQMKNEEQTKIYTSRELKQIMNEDHFAFLKIVERASDDVALIPKSLSGRLRIFHHDDFENKQSYEEYYLVTPEKDYLLLNSEFVPIPDILLDVRGYVVDDYVFVLQKQYKKGGLVGIELTYQGHQSWDDQSLGEQKSLFVPIKFLDSSNELPSKEDLTQIILRGQFTEYINEVSRNKTWFTGTVTDWILLNTTSDYFNSNIQYLLERIDFEHDISNYKRIIFLPDKSLGGSSERGLSTHYINGQPYLFSFTIVGLDSYNSPSYWGEQPFNWTNLDVALTHEIIHALGMPHANGWVCYNNNTLYGQCYHLEYGNQFDIMGFMRVSLHTNLFYKESLGWVNNEDVLFINNSGIYAISYLENKVGFKGAKINNPNNNDTPFYLEWRKPVGFDAKLNYSQYISNTDGLMINWIQNSGQTQFPRLLDMTPSDDFDSVTLNNNSVFRAPSFGIDIGPIISINDTEITFNVNLYDPVCVYNAPVIQSANLKNIFVTNGSKNKVTISFKNIDSKTLCNQSKYIPQISFNNNGYGDFFTYTLSAIYKYQLYENISFLNIEPETYGDFFINYEISQNISFGTDESIDAYIKSEPDSGQTNLYSLPYIINFVFIHPAILKYGEISDKIYAIPGQKGLELLSFNFTSPPEDIVSLFLHSINFQIANNHDMIENIYLYVNGEYINRDRNTGGNTYMINIDRNFNPNETKNLLLMANISSNTTSQINNDTIIFYGFTISTNYNPGHFYLIDGSLPTINIQLNQSNMFCNTGNACLSLLCVNGVCSDHCAPNGALCGWNSGPYTNYGICTQPADIFEPAKCDDSVAAYYDSVYYNGCSRPRGNSVEALPRGTPCDNDGLAGGFIANGICDGQGNCIREYIGVISIDKQEQYSEDNIEIQ